jgi:hypothetical protein
LKALQNSMIFKPRCPKAGPMGGEGLAEPAGTCNLIYPVIFFATIASVFSRYESLAVAFRPHPPG